MMQIETLQDRLSAALEDISKGLDLLERPIPDAPESPLEETGVDAAEIETLKEELAAVRSKVADAEAAQARAEDAERQAQAALDQAQVELEQERASVTQLEDNITDLTAKLAQADAAADDQNDLEIAVQDAPAAPESNNISDLSGPLTELDSRLFTLQKAHDALLENNVALRQAALSGLADTDGINMALQAELDAVNAARAADQAEARAIYSALAAMVGDTLDAEAIGASEGSVA